MTASDGGYGIDVSDDGSVVTFLSARSDWSSAGPTDLVSGVDVSPYSSIYVRDMNVSSGAPVALVNAAPDGTPSDNNNYGSGSVISGNGEYVAFTSAASNLVEGVSGGPQVYVKNLSTGEVVVASETADGIAGNGFSAINSMSFSSDGRFLSFESSASNLVEGDTNDKYDVFVKDLQTGAIELVSVGNDDAQARDAGISDDGTTITFRTWGDNGSNIFAVANPLHPLWR